ncbi:MAG: pyridoxamine 5'-phosphate oxidase family protein [Acidimicrobiaceae bacterium]|nr:pyridoxamine 5'-phosphate oxidase family protein [Acidimicrobiaceae bacterium]
MDRYSALPAAPSRPTASIDFLGASQYAPKHGRIWGHRRPGGLAGLVVAEQRLLTERNFWFVTADAEGRPHSMPLWGVWMPERERFGMACDSGARKARNISTNDQVVVTTRNSVECVSLEGRAVLVEGDEAEPLAVAWAEKYCDDNFSKEEMMKTVRGSTAFEVVPERAFGMIETPEEFSKCATRWLWD